MSWLYGISLIGFVSTTIRAVVAAVVFAVVGAPEPRDDRRGADHRMSLLVLTLLITLLLVIRVPIAFAFIGPCARST